MKKEFYALGLFAALAAILPIATFPLVGPLNLSMDWNHPGYYLIAFSIVLFLSAGLNRHQLSTVVALLVTGLLGWAAVMWSQSYINITYGSTGNEISDAMLGTTRFEVGFWALFPFTLLGIWVTAKGIKSWKQVK